MSFEDPVELFRSLPLRPEGQIKNLWPVEVEVLKKYYSELKDEKRLALELPTGSGKSIISLLILESWRKSGKRVALLTSSLALADDMKRRCDDLRIENVVITGRRREDELEDIARARAKRKYARKQAIGIMNYWAYMMGKDIVEPDVLVIDDADSFENLLVSYYGVTVSKQSDPDLWNEIMDELSRESVYKTKIETLRLSETTEETQLIYFTHSNRLLQNLRTSILSKGRAVSEGLSYDFLRNKGLLHTYLMHIDSDTASFIPFITPGFMHEKLHNVERIILMSATIGRRSSIHREIGSDSELKIITENDVKSKIGTMGKRIIFPLEGIVTSPHEGQLLSVTINIYESFGKALILCNSFRDAYLIKSTLESKGHSATIYRKELDSTTFANSKSGALITAGRFVGLDFPGETCRVAIIPKMPYVLGPNDAVMTHLLEDKDYANERVSHRLVQAFGRCNRSPDDCAIYFVLDSRLANDNAADAEVCRFFPRRMKAELDYGQDYAEIGDWARCVDLGKNLLNGKLANFDQEISDRLRDVPVSIVEESDVPYLTEIQAWHDLTIRQNYVNASKQFIECAGYYAKRKDDLSLRKASWFNYLSAFCNYLAYVEYNGEEYRQRALESLRYAVENGKTSWFSGLQTVINELQQKPRLEDAEIVSLELEDFKEKLFRSWREFKDLNSSKKREPKKVWEQIREKLSVGTHGEVCDRLKTAFELMGFEVRKRSAEIGEPDLEVFSTAKSRYVLLVEVKTREQKGKDGKTTNLVNRDDVDQIGGHKPRYQASYPGKTIYAMLFTNKDGFSDTAINKAFKSVRLLKSAEFSSFLGGILEMMEKAWKARSAYEKLAVMEKMITPDRYETLFVPSEKPEITIGELNALLQ
jgi:Holliday junction resolvase-like predicted endonuclease